MRGSTSEWYVLPFTVTVIAHLVVTIATSSSVSRVRAHVSGRHLSVLLYLPPGRISDASGWATARVPPTAQARRKEAERGRDDICLTRMSAEELPTCARGFSSLQFRLKTIEKLP